MCVCMVPTNESDRYRNTVPNNSVVRPYVDSLIAVNTFTRLHVRIIVDLNIKDHTTERAIRLASRTHSRQGTRNFHCHPT